MKLKKILLFFVIVFCSFLISSCYSSYREAGMVTGAGIGGVTGQLIGHSSKSTAIGALIGATTMGIVGDMADRVAYQSRTTHKTTPLPSNKRTDCHKVTKNVWREGKLISSTVEEVCDGKKTTNTY